jgi:hypothetical protein
MSPSKKDRPSTVIEFLADLSSTSQKPTIQTDDTVFPKEDDKKQGFSKTTQSSSSHMENYVFIVVVVFLMLALAFLPKACNDSAPEPQCEAVDSIVCDSIEADTVAVDDYEFADTTIVADSTVYYPY